MLSNTIKRIILSVIALVISLLIWHVNRNIFGNTFWICFILSVTTFLIVYTPFEIYWSFRDLYFDRWNRISSVNITSSRIKIEVGRDRKGDIEKLSADIISSKIKNDANTKMVMIIIAHGFSDTKEKLKYYYYPLVQNGYTILAYDARGTGDSKKVGRRSQFIKRIDDYKKIVNWVKNHEIYGMMDIYAVGFSIGALTVLNGSFMNLDVKKIIAISSISDYRQNLPKYNPLIMLSYYFKGVKLFPNEKENRILSPYHVIKEFKESIDQNDWEKYSERVLLIHSRNDRVINFKNFKDNYEIISQKQNQRIILRRGGHTHKKNEMILVGLTLSFLGTP